MQTKITLKNEKTLDVTKVISIDWLELSMIKKLPTVAYNKECWLNDIAYLIRTEYKNKGFEFQYLLFIDGIRIGELNFNSHYDYLPVNTVYLKFDNKLLYSTKCMTYLKYIIHVLKFEYTSIFHIDIAIDSIRNDILSFMERYKKSSNIRIKGRSKQIHTIDFGKETQTVYIGSVKSGKQVRIYSKSNEIRHSGKDYILQFYDLNGLNYRNEEVQRIELALHTKFTKNIEIEKLGDANYLASICQTHFKNFFDFVGIYKEHYKKVAKDVTPINLDGFSTTFLPKVVHTPIQTQKSLKMLLKGLYVNVLHEESNQLEPLQSDYLIAESIGAKLNFLASIDRILQRAPSLNVYFKSNEKKWRKSIKNNY